MSLQLFLNFLASGNMPPQLLQCFVLSIVIFGSSLHFLSGFFKGLGSKVCFLGVTGPNKLALLGGIIHDKSLVQSFKL